MRNTIGKLCVIIGTLLLLLSAAIFTISLVLRDSDYIEQKYRELDVGTEMGISTPDLARATNALLDYMRGERANIKVDARVNGEEVADLFSQEKEIVHMAEVQTLWLGLVGFSKFAPIAGAALLLIGFLIMEHGKRRALLSSGLFWACGIFGGVLGFLGVWAIMDFSSFWTVFHFLIFPKSLFQYLSAGSTVQAMNELNWVLDADSKMVTMLMPVFPSLVFRCAVCVILEIAFVALVAVFIRFAWRKQGKPSPIADVVVIEHDENEPMPIKGPDLVLSHKLRNAPVRMRKELLRRAENGEPLEDEPAPFELKPIVLPGQEKASDASQKPSPREEGVERSETDEVFDPDATIKANAPEEGTDDMSLTGRDIPAEQSTPEEQA